MSTTEVIESPETARRTPDGKFLNCPGPGVPSKKLLALRDRFKAATVEEAAAKLSVAIPELEADLASIDADLAAKEQAFFESISPALKYRGEVALELERARVCQHYVTDPRTFRGLDALPADAALAEYQETRRALEAVRREFSQMVEPTFDRVEALGDADRWATLSAYESARDRVDELSADEARLRQTCENIGIAIEPLEDNAMDGDPFEVERATRREVLTNV